jgi:hypothetical protein
MSTDNHDPLRCEVTAARHATDVDTRRITRALPGSRVVTLGSLFVNEGGKFLSEEIEDGDVYCRC